MLFRPRDQSRNKLVIREVAPFGLYTLESTGGGAAAALPDEVA